MSDSRVVSREEWLAARKELLAKEKEETKRRDALRAERSEMPMVEVDKEYTFDGPDGEVKLLDLFDGRRQLIVYHFWFQPGDDEPCQGCSLWTSNLGDLSNLHERDTSLVFVSPAPIEQIEATRKSRGWTIPWYSLDGNDFNADTGYAGVAQISVFLREDDAVFLTYVTQEGRDLETLSNHWSLLDRTPAGSS